LPTEHQQSAQEIVFHDFDYVGYEENIVNRSFNREMNSIGVGRDKSNYLSVGTSARG